MYVGFSLFTSKRPNYYPKIPQNLHYKYKEQNVEEKIHALQFPTVGFCFAFLNTSMEFFWIFLPHEFEDYNNENKNN